MKKNDEQCSVVVCVYKGDQAGDFQRAMQSLFAQTKPSDDIVVVCNGRLTEPLAAAVRQLAKRPGVRALWLEPMVNVGKARNLGVKKARHQLVAIADADDASREKRFEWQLAAFRRDPGLCLVGGWVVESGTGKKRLVPEDDVALRRFAARRSPINNPAIMVKKSDFLAVGGYAESVRRGEDYILALKLLRAGKQLRNLQRVLVVYTTSKDNLRRRKTWAATKDAFRVARRAQKYKIATWFDVMIASAAHLALFLMPTSLAERLYNRSLRHG